MKAALALLVLALAAACASTPPPPVWHAVPAASLDRDLSFEEALALARGSDLRGAGWRARRDAACAAVSSAAAIPNPTLVLEWEGLGLSDAGTSLASLKAGVSYPVLFWVPRRHKIAAAAHGRAAEEWALLAEDRKLVTEVGASWYGLIADQRRARISTARAGGAHEALELAKKAQSAGVRTAYDVERATAEALESDGDAEDAAATLRRDQLAFAFALGADHPAYPRARETGEDVAPVVLEPLPAAPPDDVFAAAAADDPSLSRAHALVAQAEAELHVQQVSALPFTGVTAAAGTKQEPGVGTGGAAALEIPLPIFDRNRPGISAAYAALLSAQATEEEARRQVVGDLAADWERVRAASTKYERYARPLTELRRRAEHSARRLYETGETEQGDWLQARRDLRAAETSEVDAWRDAVVARFTLDAALGRHDLGAPPRVVPGPTPAVAAPPK